MTSKICAVWSVIIVGMKNICILGYPKCSQWRFWSDYVNVLTDLNLGWVQMSNSTLSDIAAHLLITETHLFIYTENFTSKKIKIFR